ncbi:uncharacterized protein TNCV_4050701 [Trichonephila clavipes]|nr:uncharacterized protein TNCV_4050701 [Trichonephila clavipes]
MLYPAAPLHYVNIGHKLDGDYKFGYDTGRGPLGQSFREEIRLADGTISIRTYGVVDELGHKRLVHFSAGKTGLFSQEEPSSKSCEGVTILNAYTSLNLDLFKNPAQRQLSKPFYRALFHPLVWLTISNPKQQLPFPNHLLLSNIITCKAPRTNSLLSKQSTPTQNNMVLVSQAKVEIPNKLPSLKKMETIFATSTYDPKIEDEYYDSAPPFIDVERLSYNIGTDKNASLKI